MCLGYGVLHAAGPGHGKLVIGGYGLARRVPVVRLAGLALASSLAQAAVAIALVYAVLAVLGLTRVAAEEAATRWMTPVGHAMIAGLGLRLVWRGVRGLSRDEKAHAHMPAEGHHGHAHDHDHDHTHAHGPHCTHAHGPTLDEVEALGGWRDAGALIAGIALRPCSGALFILIITFQLGIALAGVVGAVVMGLARRWSPSRPPFLRSGRAKGPSRAWARAGWRGYCPWSSCRSGRSSPSPRSGFCSAAFDAAMRRRWWLVKRDAAS
ncbi:MAG: hypothetical protein EOP93_16990 [Lysobacteraceae bacterium]|nr:MAG: hypothetical protein EOP93_16990 [Xanthomonadaceae bacterium]